MSYLIIALLGMVVVQSFLFTIYLFKYGDDAKTSILRIFTLVIGLHFFNLMLGRIIYDYQGYGLSWIFLSSYGPLIFIYVNYFLKKKRRFLLLHLLLPLYPLFLWAFTDKLHQESSADQYLDYWVSLPIYLSLFTYLFLSLGKIFQTTDKIANLKWLKYLVISMICLVLVHTSVLWFYSSGKEELANWLYAGNISYMIFFLTGMVFTALSKPDFFQAINTNSSRPKYFYTNLSSSQKKSILGRLESLMVQEKPYLLQDLTLEDVSEKLGISKRHISQVINEKLQRNFKDYINGYRIREATEILERNARDIRIYEVMYDVGFNNKSSFNFSFKKFTGLTPREYRKSILLKEQKTIENY